MSALRASLGALALLALPACSAQNPTQLVVAVDTDLDVPEALSGIEIEVTMPSGRIETRSSVLTTAAALPVTLGVVHREGPLGPIRIEARGIDDGLIAVRRSASLTLRSSESLFVHLLLDDACIALECQVGETCEEGSCRDEALRDDEIGAFSGTVPLTDAGTFDASVDAALGTDASFDAARDAACAPGTADCDATPGCETTLGTTRDCLRCGDTCLAPVGGSASCGAAGCESTCNGALDDCDTSSPDCETNTNTSDAHCGRCDNPCTAGTSCRAGTCR